MKTILLNTSAFTKKMVALLLPVLIAVSSATACTADSAISDQNVSVSCLRVENGHVFFNVKFANADGSRFDVLVNDETGDNLYRATFTDKSFNRIFRAPVDNGKLVIIIRDIKDKTSHRFELSSEAKLIEQVYVKRM